MSTIHVLQEVIYLIRGITIYICALQHALAHTLNALQNALAYTLN